jgi:hypothetical protein
MTASYIQESAGPAKRPPIRQDGIRSKTLEERMESRTPAAKGRNPIRVRRFVRRNFEMLRSRTSVYRGNPVRRFPFEEEYVNLLNKEAIMFSYLAP